MHVKTRGLIRVVLVRIAVGVAKCANKSGQRLFVACTTIPVTATGVTVSVPGALTDISQMGRIQTNHDP